jgi:hypothetical protein
MSEEDSNHDSAALAAGRTSIVTLIRGVPPELRAIGSMLSVQLGGALAVPVMAPSDLRQRPRCDFSGPE